MNPCWGCFYNKPVNITCNTCDSVCDNPNELVYDGETCTGRRDDHLNCELKDMNECGNDEPCEDCKDFNTCRLGLDTK